MRLLTPQDTGQNLALAHTLSLNQSGGSTSIKVETLQRFDAAGALICPLLAEDIQSNSELPDWLPVGGDIKVNFIPRGYMVCFVLNQQGYELACSGVPLADLVPWQAGDGAAYVLIVTIISHVRNGVARLIMAFTERALAHPAYPHVKEVMWYTRTAKGQAMTQYFAGRETGRTVTRVFANGKSQTMPMYSLSVADWQKHAEAVVEKLLGIESNFSDTLAEIHQKLAKKED